MAAVDTIEDAIAAVVAPTANTYGPQIGARLQDAELVLGSPQVPLAAELLATHYHIIVGSPARRGRKCQAIANTLGVDLAVDQAVEHIYTVRRIARENTLPICANAINRAGAADPAAGIVATLHTCTFRNTIRDADAHFTVVIVGAETANAIATIGATFFVDAGRFASALANPFDALLEEWGALATSLPATIRTALNSPTLGGASADNALAAFAKRLGPRALTTAGTTTVKTAFFAIASGNARSRFADSVETALPHRAHTALTTATVIAALYVGTVSLALWSADCDLLFPVSLQQDTVPPRRAFIAARLGTNLAVQIVEANARETIIVLGAGPIEKTLSSTIVGNAIEPLLTLPTTPVTSILATALALAIWGTVSGTGTIGAYWIEFRTLPATPPTPIVSALTALTVRFTGDDTKALLTFGGSARALPATSSTAVVTALKTITFGYARILAVGAIARAGSLSITPFAVAGVWKGADEAGIFLATLSRRVTAASGQQEQRCTQN